MYPTSREYSCAAESFSTDIDCSAATKEEIVNTGVTVASLFFHNVFGTEAQKALTVFVALR